MDDHLVAKRAEGVDAFWVVELARVVAINGEQVLVFEGKDKVVFYGQPGVFINAGSLEFAARLDDFAQVDYRNIELSQGVQDEADLILSSLEVSCRDG